METGREIFWMGIPCGAHKTPPSAYILHKISKPPNANKKGRREYVTIYFLICELITGKHRSKATKNVL
jgi:hypothetical protein